MKNRKRRKTFSWWNDDTHAGKSKQQGSDPISTVNVAEKKLLSDLHESLPKRWSMEEITNMGVIYYYFDGENIQVLPYHKLSKDAKKDLATKFIEAEEYDKRVQSLESELKVAKQYIDVLENTNNWNKDVIIPDLQKELSELKAEIKRIIETRCKGNPCVFVKDLIELSLSEPKEVKKDD